MRSKAYKIVYYGPAMAGKTSNCVFISRNCPIDISRPLEVVMGDDVRMVTFDCIQTSRRWLVGTRITWHCWALSGPYLNREAAATLLRDADGAVFVADSQREKIHQDILSLREFFRIIVRHGWKPSTFPLVLQYNKRDMPNILPVEVMDKYLNPIGWPRLASIACTGEGVLETFAAIRREIRRKHP